MVGIVFYGVKSNLLAYYRLESKNPTGTLNLDALGKFIAKYGIPGKIITDSHGKLGAGKVWKNYLRRLFVPLSFSEPDKHNHNFVESAIHILKEGLSKIRNACEAEVLAYHWEAMEYLCSMNNYVSRESLNNRFLYETFWGETPEISMIRFKLWEPVYYQNLTETASKVLMHPGRFMGFAWDVGDPMTFKVLQCHANPKRRAQVLHRGAVVPRALDAAGYNSALQQKSEHYFPIVRPEGGITRKTLPLAQHGNVDAPDSAILEGGGKRRRLPSPSSDELSMGQSTAYSSKSVVDEPILPDDLSATANRGNVNEEGATDEMEWSEMEQ